MLGLNLGMGSSSGSGTGGAGTPSLADYFSGHQGLAIDLSDISKLWQDTTGGTQVAADSDPIGQVDDISGNAHEIIQVSGAAKPLYDSAGAATFSGAQFWNVTGSQSSLAFLHKDGGFGIVALVRFGAVADPNAFYCLFGSNGTSGTVVGTSLYYDDRASQSRNDRVVYNLSNGSIHVYNSVSADNDLPAVTDVNLTISVPTGGPADVAVAGAGVATSAKAGANSGANSAFVFQIGAGGNGVGKMVGQVRQFALRDEVFSASELAGIATLFASKL